MFSFAKIATFAALAFGTIASAIPSPAPVAAPESGELAKRQSQDVTTILTNLNNNLKAPIDALSTPQVPFFVHALVDRVYRRHDGEHGYS